MQIKKYKSMYFFLGVY